MGGMEGGGLIPTNIVCRDLQPKREEKEKREYQKQQINNLKELLYNKKKIM